MVQLLAIFLFITFYASSASASVEIYELEATILESQGPSDCEAKAVLQMKRDAVQSSLGFMKLPLSAEARNRLASRLAMDVFVTGRKRSGPTGCRVHARLVVDELTLQKQARRLMGQRLQNMPLGVVIRYDIDGQPVGLSTSKALEPTNSLQTYLNEFQFKLVDLSRVFDPLQKLYLTNNYCDFGEEETFDDCINNVAPVSFTTAATSVLDSLSEVYGFAQEAETDFASMDEDFSTFLKPLLACGGLVVIGEVSTKETGSAITATTRLNVMSLKEKGRIVAPWTNSLTRSMRDGKAHAQRQAVDKLMLHVADHLAKQLGRQRDDLGC